MEILIILFLIMLNGVFSMSEIALISARKNRLENAAKKGNKNAKAALDLANSPNKFLSTVQIGITLIGILTGIYSGDKITTDVQNFVATFEALKPLCKFNCCWNCSCCFNFFLFSFRRIITKTNWIKLSRKYCKSGGCSNENCF
jgi:CBS domain containing-hemolysin-like protein